MRRMRERLSLAPLAMLVVGLAACSPAVQTSEKAKQPDVLLITVDTLRADHLGSYGYSRATSPNLDRMAAEGTRFDVAYAPIGATCPSHATLFTALLPTSHGLVRNGLPLREEETVLAEFLRDAGYQTAGFVSSYPLNAELGFAQGFDHYDDDFMLQDPALDDTKAAMKKQKGGPDRWAGFKVEGAFSRPAGATASALIDWLEAAGSERPVFIWLHLFDAHTPYEAPPPFRGKFKARGQRRGLAGYDEGILYADSEIGRVVAAMTSLRETRTALVIATSDHGEGLFDHGEAGHNWSTFEEEVRIPLIFHWPGKIPAGRSLAQPAHLADLPPTLASLLGLDWKAGAAGDHGLDLAPHILAEIPPDTERTLYLQRPYYPGRRAKNFPDYQGWGLALRQGKWKYFEALSEDRRELYDLEKDPRETTNLYAQHRRVAAGLATKLERWNEELTVNMESLKARVSPEVQEALISLGYIGDEEPEDSESAK